MNRRRQTDVAGGKGAGSEPYAPQIPSAAAVAVPPIQLVTRGDPAGSDVHVRFPLSLRTVEDQLFERGIDICHETVRMWWNRFDPMFAGEIFESCVTKTRDRDAALTFMKRAPKRHGKSEAITNDGLRSYGAAMKELGKSPSCIVWRPVRIRLTALPEVRREMGSQCERPFACDFASIVNAPRRYPC